MIGEQPRPWSGIALALVAGGAMIFAGSGLWLTLAIVALWIGSLWLLLPEPPPAAKPADPMEVRNSTREAMIETLGHPLLLIEQQRIVAANLAAREALGGHILGQDARIALRHPEAMQMLDDDQDGSVTIPGFAGSRTLWQLTRRRIDGRTWLIELADRTSEADVSRAHTDFVANASHELRTPLAAIIGYAETLQDAASDMDTATRDRFLSTVLREARRMQALVSDLMSLSQVEAEKHDLPNEELDLARLAERTAGEAAALAGKERIIVRVPAEAVMVRGDRSQLEQVVRNLIDNALKYGDPTEAVDIDLTPRDPGSAELTVRDRGAGISPEHLPHLTRRFYRTDPGRSRAAGGTGLGLAIVKHIVERHRGRLDIASTLGVGTCVSVMLPARFERRGELS